MKSELFLDLPITLRQLDLLTVELPLKEPFLSAIGKRMTREALIVRWISQDGVIGYGECSCRPDPYYSHEFLDAAVFMAQRFIIPALKPNSTLRKLHQSIKKIRGWNFTKAAFEFACCDAVERFHHCNIIDNFGFNTIEKIPVGISMGIYSDLLELQERTYKSIKDGYRRVKFKIRPGSARPDFIHWLEELDFDLISFDANGSFDHSDFEALNAFAQLGYIIEQPFRHGSIYLEKEFQSTYSPLNICLDEEIESLHDVKRLEGSYLEINLKPGRVGGIVETMNIIKYCLKKSIPCWIGGMFETGIGRKLNLRLASLLHEARAHDLSPSSRYFEEDLLDKPIVMENGYIDYDSLSSMEVSEEMIKNHLKDNRIISFKY